LEGLEKRDRLVFQKARAKNIPVAVTLAGGYARHVEDTVFIHINTIRVAREFAIYRGA
jgi:acetoin utilization deacetylase AcuC-like enzyme